MLVSTPSLSAEENLAADTLIDVGHESLLRRWEKVSGKPGALDPQSKGWLRAEEADGQRYRRLLDSTKLHRKQFLEDWPWWTKPPRTRDWANRYGGKYEQVDSLLRESQRADKRKIVAICFATAAGFTLMVAGTYFGYDYIRKRDEAAFADEYYNRAKGAAVTLMEEVQKSLNAGSMKPSTAQALVETAEEILATLTKRKETPDITARRAEASLMVSDAYSDSGDKPRAFQYVEKARELAKDLTREHPDNTGFQHLLFRTLFRIADAAAMRRDPHARQDYGDALAVIEKLIARQPANDEWKKDSAFIYGKLGDISQGKKDFQDALKDYQTSVGIMEKVVANDRRGNFLWRRDVASARDRVGQAYAGLEDYKQALENYSSALSLRLELIKEQPDNGIVQTHVAVSHREVGDTLKRLGRIDDAIIEFRKELAMREVIADSDPGNASKQVTLALTLERVGRELHERQRIPETIDLYRQALAVWTKLVKRDQNNSRWRQGLQTIEKKIADLTAEPR